MVGLIHAVLSVQTQGRDKPIDLRFLNGEDLRYVQEWDLMLGYSNAAQWYAARLEAIRVLTAAQSYHRHYQPSRLSRLRGAASRDLASAAADAREAYHRLAAMQWDEHQAVTTLGFRDISRRWARAKWAMLVWGVAAAASILFLTWAANPPATPAP